jgi:hypothetical protein
MKHMKIVPFGSIQMLNIGDHMILPITAVVPHEQVPVSDVTPRRTVIVTIGSRSLLNYLMMSLL